MNPLNKVQQVTNRGAIEKKNILVPRSFEYCSPHISKAARCDVIFKSSLKRRASALPKYALFA